MSPSGPLPCSPSLQFTITQSRATGIADHILPFGDLFSFINRPCKRFNYTSVTDFFVRVNQFIKKEHSQRRLRENTQFRYLVSLIAVSPDIYKLLETLGY